MDRTKQRCKAQSLASLAPAIAWRLLKEAEQQLILNYLAKVGRTEVKQAERQLELASK